MCSLYATNFLNSACLYDGSKLARLAWQLDTLLQKGRKIMELDANMADALVELLKTKNGLKDIHVATFEAHSRPSTFEDALEKAIKLSRAQAHEVWYALQLLVGHESLVGQPAAVVELAMEFNPFPITWKVIADKALEYEHLTVKQKA